MKKAAQFRSQLNRSIRTFFDQRGYLEVETPTLSPDLIPEPTIQNFATTFDNEFVGSRELYLIPSPEVYMKKLIADGFGSIYQIGHCFRNSEQIGRHHNPEFSMLEYYSVGMDESDSIGLT
ncbi:MAG TPA: amino acid--tRNA ligase-related protein, partial [Sphaerochaeta sp.]|nr:amino acid--tRNA ligase-related protein [Sphaerochaeta sp.]